MQSGNVLKKLLCLAITVLLIYSVNSVAVNNGMLSQSGVRIFNFFDKQRDKKISLQVWYPITADTSVEFAKGIWKQGNVAHDAPVDVHISTAKNGKLPLIVLSHGFHGAPETLSWLAFDLVKHGFIVVAPQHDDSGANTGKPYMEHWQRAVDVSFILQELQRTEFAKNIDFSRIGMVGYSLGTATGLWLAGGVALSYERTVNPGRQFVPEEEFAELGSEEANYLLQHTDFQAAKQSYREPLIKAVLLIAPGYGWAFPAKQLGQVKMPIFLVAAEKDEMLYPETNAYYLAKFLPNARMKIIPDVGHFVFINETVDANDKRLSSEEIKRIQFTRQLGKFQYTAKERANVQELVGNLAANFFLDSLH